MSEEKPNLPPAKPDDQARQERDRAAAQQLAADIAGAFEGFKELQSQWRTLAPQIPAWVAEVAETRRRISEALTPVVAQVYRGFQTLQPIFEAIARQSAESERVEKAGWLPHPTLPAGILAGIERTPEAFDTAIGNYYREQWDEVSTTLRRRVESYALDEQAKAAYADALAIHGLGAYRGTTRMLFPEIERVVRIELHGGAIRSFASQKEFRQAAGDLPLSATDPNGFYSFRFYAKLLDHLYAKADSEDRLAIVAPDPVPNRHAAVHGLVPYDTAKSSLNMLVMTDFLFQVICAVKRAAEEGEVDANPDERPREQIAAPQV